MKKYSTVILICILFGLAYLSSGFTGVFHSAITFGFVLGLILWIYYGYLKKNPSPNNFNKSMILNPIPKPKGDAMNQYLNWWNWCLANLNLILDYKPGLQSEIGKKLAISKMLYQAKVNYSKGDSSGAVDLAHLKNFVEDLEFLRVRDFELYKNYILKFTSGVAREYGFLTGTWFEIRIARKFIESNLDYSRPKQDPPDFWINLKEDSVLGVECYAPRILPGEDIRKKVINSITNKTKRNRNEDWVSKPTVLILDYSWIIKAQNNDDVNGQEILSSDVRDELIETSKSSYFDLIMCFFFGHAKISDNRTSSCFFIQKDLKNELITDFRKKLLGGFKEENKINIIRAQMPN